MTLKSVRDLEVICPHPKMLHASYIVGGVIVPELHDMYIGRLPKVVTPAWVTNTSSFALVIDYIHYSGSFEILQVKVKCLFCSFPRAQNKHYSERNGQINVSFMYCS